MQRPHPLSAPGSFDCSPQRMISARESPDHIGQDFADHLDRGAARLLDHCDIEVALLVGLHFGFADRFQSRGFEEAGDGVLRRADARALLLLAHVGLARRHAVHGERQPPRRHERLGAFVDQPCIDQPVGHRLAQILRRPRLHARRNLFGEQFKQKIRHQVQRVLLPLPLRGRGVTQRAYGCRRTSAFSTDRLQAQNHTFSDFVALNSIGVKP